jgi:hypothetical protein
MCRGQLCVACVNLARGGLRLRNSLEMLRSNHLTLLRPKKLGDRRRVRRNSCATFCSETRIVCRESTLALNDKWPSRRAVHIRSRRTHEICGASALVVVPKSCLEKPTATQEKVSPPRPNNFFNPLIVAELVSQTPWHLRVLLSNRSVETRFAKTAVKASRIQYRLPVFLIAVGQDE